MKDSRVEEEAWLVLSLSCAPNAMKARRRKRGADGVFECKTCYKQFPSFQALGGHRTSHKRPSPGGAADRTLGWKLGPVLHKCGVCGLEFPLGQALGGHMRRHKKTMAAAMPGDLFPDDGADLDAAERSEKGGLHGILLELFV